jgi:thiamine biosynthesis protein ThiS
LTAGTDKSGETIEIKWPVRVGYIALTITLNGDPFDLSGPLTVTELLASLEIDARRVAVEHNLVVLKRAAFDATLVSEGDSVEIVNFVGGG